MITGMSRFLDMTEAAEEHAPGAEAASSETVAAPPSPETAPRSGRRFKPRERFQIYQYALLLYLFFYCSRVSEVAGWMRFAVVLLPIMVVGLIVSGRSKAILNMPYGKVLIAFTVWVALCVPTSLWRSDSLRVWRGNLIALLLVACMAAFVRTIRDCLRVIYTIALAMGLVAILGLAFGRQGQSRLGAGVSTTLQDPNFFSLYLLIGICFLSLSASVHKGFKRLLSQGLIVLCLGAAARTGSRMGLLAFVVVVLMFFIFGNSKQRMYLVVGCVLLAVVVPPLLPESTRHRFLILFQPGARATDEDIAAAESAQIRRELFFRSLRFTMEHPLFGVGPGQFIQADVDLAQEEHRKATWLYPHNAYTETSSETGLIGAALFIVAFFGAQVGLHRIRKRGPDLLTRRMALFIHLALIVSSIGAFFLTLGYSGIIWVLMGVSGTFKMAVARQAKLAQGAAR